MTKEINVVVIASAYILLNKFQVFIRAFHIVTHLNFATTL